MAEVILHGHSELIDISPVALTRFKEGQLILESLTAFKH
jgi:hypothetical protein